MNKRIERKALHMKTAGLYSQRSGCMRLGVGAVAVRDNRIIATGYNGPLPNQKHCSEHTCDLSQPCTRSVHAEANLITFCAKDGISLKGAHLYCTHAPCLKCAELIIQSGIEKVYYSEEFRSMDGVDLLIGNKVTTELLRDDNGNTYI